MYQKYQDLMQLRTFLQFNKDGQPSDRRLKVCVAGLLYLMAASDHNVNQEEMQEIIRLLDSEFQMMDDESEELFEMAGFIEREAELKNQELEQLNKFLEEANNSLDSAQRSHLFDMIWRVAQADKFVKPIEKEFAAFIRKALRLAPNAT